MQSGITTINDEYIDAVIEEWNSPIAAKEKKSDKGKEKVTEEGVETSKQNDILTSELLAKATILQKICANYLYIPPSQITNSVESAADFRARENKVIQLFRTEFFKSLTLNKILVLLHCKLSLAKEQSVKSSLSLSESYLSSSSEDLTPGAQSSQSSTSDYKSNPTEISQYTAEASPSVMEYLATHNAEHILWFLADKNLINLNKVAIKGRGFANKMLAQVQKDILEGTATELTTCKDVLQTISLKLSPIISNSKSTITEVKDITFEETSKYEVTSDLKASKLLADSLQCSLQLTMAFKLQNLSLNEEEFNMLNKNPRKSLNFNKILQSIKEDKKDTEIEFKDLTEKDLRDLFLANALDKYLPEALKKPNALSLILLIRENCDEKFYRIILDSIHIYLNTKNRLQKTKSFDTKNLNTAGKPNIIFLKRKYFNLYNRLELLFQGENIDYYAPQDPNKKTALYYAVEAEKNNIVEFLLKSGASRKIPLLDVEFNPLKYAIKNNLWRSVKLLIEVKYNNQEPWIENDYIDILNFIIICLTYTNSPTPEADEIAKLVIDKCLFNDQKLMPKILDCLWKAIERNNYEIASKILQKITTTDLSKIYQRDEYTKLLTHVILSNNLYEDKISVIKPLLDLGANIYQPNMAGYTVLGRLINKDTKVIKYLLKNSKNVPDDKMYINSALKKFLERDISNETESQEVSEIAQLLIEKGANIHFDMPYNGTPLCLAIKKYPQLALTFLENDAYEVSKIPSYNIALRELMKVYKVENEHHEALFKALIQKDANIYSFTHPQAGYVSIIKEVSYHHPNNPEFESLFIGFDNEHHNHQALLSKSNQYLKLKSIEKSFKSLIDKFNILIFASTIIACLSVPAYAYLLATSTTNKHLLYTAIVSSSITLATLGTNYILHAIEDSLLATCSNYCNRSNAEKQASSSPVLTT